MGLDFIDLKFRIEREFDIQLDGQELAAELVRLIEMADQPAAGKAVWDFTVQQLLGVVCNRIYHQHGSVPDDVWLRMVKIIVEVLYVKPEEVTPQAYLVRDLGMA